MVTSDFAVSKECLLKLVVFVDMKLLLTTSMINLGLLATRLTGERKSSLSFQEPPIVYGTPWVKNDTEEAEWVFIKSTGPEHWSKSPTAAGSTNVGPGSVLSSLANLVY